MGCGLCHTRPKLASRGDNFPVRADGPEARSIIGEVKVNPLELRLIVPDEVSARGRFAIDLEIRNHGDLRLRDLVATLYTADDCLRVSGPNSHRRGMLHEDSHISVKWRVESIGNSAACEDTIVLASVSATDRDGDVITQESPAQVLAIGK